MRKWLIGVGSLACALFIVTAILALRAAEAPAPAAPKVDFNRDVRQILTNHCYACHGPDENKRKAGLRLDRKCVVGRADHRWLLGQLGHVQGRRR